MDGDFIDSIREVREIEGHDSTMEALSSFAEIAKLKQDRFRGFSMKSQNLFPGNLLSLPNTPRRPRDTTAGILGEPLPLSGQTLKETSSSPQRTRLQKNKHKDAFKQNEHNLILKELYSPEWTPNQTNNFQLGPFSGQPRRMEYLFSSADSAMRYSPEEQSPTLTLNLIPLADGTSRETHKSSNHDKPKQIKPIKLPFATLQNTPRRFDFITSPVN